MWNLGTTPGPMQGRGKCSLLLLLLREQRAGQRPEPPSLSPDTKEQQETEAKGAQSCRGTFCHSAGTSHTLREWWPAPWDGQEIGSQWGSGGFP